MTIISGFTNSKYDFILRLFTACILGCLIGYERKNRDKDAGMRTHAIVCAGSCFFMIISKYGFQDTVNFDPGRIASQVVTGVGFLGAGIIFVKDNIVNGLTTAAGIWATSGIGMALGAGLYFIGIFTCILLLLIQSMLHNISILTNEQVRDYIKITTTSEYYEDLIKDFTEIIDDKNIKCNDIKLSKVNEKYYLTFFIYYPNDFDKTEFFLNLMKDPRIVEISD